MRALILTALLAAPVQAQTACAPLEAFLAGLAERYAEAPRASGLMQGGQLLSRDVDGAGGDAGTDGLHGGVWGRVRAD